MIKDGVTGDQIFALLDVAIKAGYANVQVFTAVFDYFKDRQEPKRVLDAWNIMKTLPMVEPTDDIYATVCNALMFSRMHQEGLDVLSKMERPQSRFYNTMVDHLSEEHKLKEALDLVELMKQRGVRPDVITYGTIMKHYKELDILVDLYQRLRADGVKPTGVTMYLMIEAYGRYEAIQHRVRTIACRLRNTCLAISLASHNTTSVSNHVCTLLIRDKQQE